MQLVYDRTQTDVLLGTDKGRYGAADLNRVEQAVGQLCGLAAMLDLDCALQLKTDWALPRVFSPETWPTRKQMARYLMNVQYLCDTMALAAKLPTTMERLTWENANEIERALQLVFNRIQGILQAFRFSGELYAGEENQL